MPPVAVLLQRGVDGERGRDHQRTQLLGSGVPLQNVQDAMGHADSLHDQTLRALLTQPRSPMRRTGWALICDGQHKALPTMTGEPSSLTAPHLNQYVPRRPEWAAMSSQGAASSRWASSRWVGQDRAEAIDP